jgi:hypothetical protein
MGDDPDKVLPEDVKDLFKSIDDIVTDHVVRRPLTPDLSDRPADGALEDGD